MLDLLSDAQAAVEPLFDQPLVPMYVLRAEVVAYRDYLQREEPLNADLGMGLSVARSSLRMLGRLGDRPDPRAHRLAQVAVRYFVCRDDGDGDLQSLFGFDDDAEVLNQVVRRLGMTDLALA